MMGKAVHLRPLSGAKAASPRASHDSLPALRPLSPFFGPAALHTTHFRCVIKDPLYNPISLLDQLLKFLTHKTPPSYPIASPSIPLQTIPSPKSKRTRRPVSPVLSCPVQLARFSLNRRAALSRMVAGPIISEHQRGKSALCFLSSEPRSCHSTLD